MNHLDESLLFAYIDDELPVGERRAVSAHLGTCPQCAAQLLEWRGLLGEIDALPELALRVDLADAVIEQVSAETALASSPAMSWIAALQVAMLLCGIAAAWPLLRLLSAGVVASSAEYLTAPFQHLSAISIQAGHTLTPLLNFPQSVNLPNLPPMFSLLLLSLALLIWLLASRFALRGLEPQ